MKKTRDSFYVALRDRLQALNPSRQVLVRGVWRPGVLVEENESFVASAPDNVFVLRWTKTTVEGQHALVRALQTCEVQYQSAGTATSGGLDRGSLLTAMDEELLSIVQPLQTHKLDYSGSTPVEMGTRISWTWPVLGSTVRERDRLVRKAEITVVSYEEAQEL